MEQELLTLSEHLSSHPVFSGVQVVRYLVFCVVFCRSMSGCPSSIYGLRLSLWFLQTFLMNPEIQKHVPLYVDNFYDTKDLVEV